MTYVSTWAFDADGADITPDVESARFFHGNQLRSARNPARLIRGRGRMLLENGDGYWTEARLDALDTLKFINDGIEVVVCKVTEAKLIPRRRLARLTLRAQHHESYDRNVGFNTITTASLATVLAATGLDLTPRTAWPTWQVDEGERYCEGTFKAVRDFADFADAFAMEDFDGSYVAVVPETEMRTPGLTIDDSSHWIHIDRREFIRQREWLRDAQLATTLNSTIASVDVTVPGLPSRWSNIGQIVDKGPDDVDREVRFDTISLGGLENRRADFVSLDLPSTNDFEIVSATGVNAWSERWAREWEASPSGVRIRANLRSGFSGSDISDHNIAFEDDFTITLRFFSQPEAIRFQENAYYATDGDTSVLGFLPTMPFLVAETSQFLFQSKLERWANFVPEVTRLSFLTDQETEARWHEIRDLRLGDAVNLNLMDDGLMLASSSWPMYKEWRYHARLDSSCEIHFLSYGGISSEQVYFETEEQPVYFETEDQPVERVT